MASLFAFRDLACLLTTFPFCTRTVVEVSLSPVRGSVREGAGGARVNVSVVQGSLGGDTVSFVVSTVNGSAQSKTINIILWTINLSLDF